MKLYKSYMFKTKDPILDAFHTALDDSGMTTTEVALASNVSVSTYRAWRTGKTRRPQFAARISLEKNIEDIMTTHLGSMELESMELVRVFAKHEPYTDGHLGQVIKEMEKLGSPVIKVVEWRGDYIAAGVRSLGGDGITFGKDGSPRITGVRKAPARPKLRVVSG